METGSVSAIISATAGVTGVLLGNLFVAVKEWIVSRTRRPVTDHRMKRRVRPHLYV
jgi:hypothetical protein